jgi:hypothetical protein
LKQYEADYLKQQEKKDGEGQNGSTPADKHHKHHHHNAVGDLFSEIHLNELRKLEQKLEQVSQNLEV